VKYVVIVLALALLPVVAHAQDTKRWKRITISDGDTTSIDTRSIVQAYGYGVSVWVETRFKAPHTTSEFGRNYTRQVLRQTFDCKARTVAISAWSTYTRDGSVAGSGDLPLGIVMPRAILPGSIFESILEAVC
jgi:hypothetical protein